jgi:hypothetical protein
MTPAELILAFLLTIVIVVDLKIPDAVLGVLGSAPGFVIILGTIFFLFMKSATLGVLGIIAGFMLLQQANPKSAPGLYASRTPEPLPMEPVSTFPVTLEETMVRNIIPLVNNSPSAAFTNSVSNVRNASCL